MVYKDNMIVSTAWLYVQNRPSSSERLHAPGPVVHWGLEEDDWWVGVYDRAGGRSLQGGAHQTLNIFKDQTYENTTFHLRNKEVCNNMASGTAETCGVDTVALGTWAQLRLQQQPCFPADADQTDLTENPGAASRSPQSRFRFFSITVYFQY